MAARAKPTKPTKTRVGKSGGKSGKRPGTFVSGDPRSGRGPKKGAPNAGRPPNRIREVLRGSFEDRVKVLEAVADGEPIVRTRLPNGMETETLTSAPIADRLRALDMMAKYGLGTQIEVPVDPDGDDVKGQVVVWAGHAVRF